jgi:ribosome maturation factor RimP
MSEFILKKVEDFLGVLLPAEGLKLFDLQFRREGHGWVLRVFIDSDDGVSLDNCSAVSRELGQYLDVEDLIDHAYHLEVSSPGLERPLRNLEDFRRFTGRKARVKLHEARQGNKIFEGIIKEIQGDQITLLIDGGQDLEFTFDTINKARLAI